MNKDARPDVFKCPICKKLVLEAEKTARAVAGGGAVLVHSVCGTVLEKVNYPDVLSDNCD